VLARLKTSLQHFDARLPKASSVAIEREKHRLDAARLRLELLNPGLVLTRGYAWLADMEGHALTSTQQLRLGQAVRATLADGEVDLTVSAKRLI
jgi:exodeoxyribonuclease VII large subunit